MRYTMTSPLELAKFLAAQPVVLVVESDAQDAEKLSNRLSQLDCDVVNVMLHELDRLKDNACHCSAVFMDESALGAARLVKDLCPNTPIIVLVEGMEPSNEILEFGPITLARKNDLSVEKLAGLLQTFKVKVRVPCSCESTRRAPAAISKF